MTQESIELCNPSNEVTRGQRHRRSGMANCKMYAPTFVENVIFMKCPLKFF